MAWDLAPVDVDFFEKAPFRFVATEVVHRPADLLFDAIAVDAPGWAKWFPGFSRGRYATPPPHGPGSRREVTMAGIRYQDTVLVWERPHRWAFYVSRAGLPLGRRIAEDYRISSHGPYSLIQWTFALDPPPVVGYLMGAGRPLMHALFRRAMTNLSARLQDIAGG
jgi:Polyketide cyclase / dehydrase and lipid transport